MHSFSRKPKKSSEKRAKVETTRPYNNNVYDAAEPVLGPLKIYPSSIFFLFFFLSFPWIGIFRPSRGLVPPPRRSSEASWHVVYHSVRRALHTGVGVRPAIRLGATRVTSCGGGGTVRISLCPGTYIILVHCFARVREVHCSRHSPVRRLFPKRCNNVFMYTE